MDPDEIGQWMLHHGRRGPENDKTIQRGIQRQVMTPRKNLEAQIRGSHAMTAKRRITIAMPK
jgi:hypothetical protein